MNTFHKHIDKIVNFICAAFKKSIFIDASDAEQWLWGSSSVTRWIYRILKQV